MRVEEPASEQALLMKKRIAIGGIWHETNGFRGRIHRAQRLSRLPVREGPALLERYRGTGTELGGMIGAAEECDFELLPMLFAGAVPSATIARGALDTLCEGICSCLAAFGTLDGMLLVLHGAASAEGIDDADAYVLERIREVLPRPCPIRRDLRFPRQPERGDGGRCRRARRLRHLPPRRHGRARGGGGPSPRPPAQLAGAPGEGAREGAAADRSPEAGHRPRAGKVHHGGAARDRVPAGSGGVAPWLSASPTRMPLTWARRCWSTPTMRRAPELRRSLWRRNSGRAAKPSTSPSSLPTTRWPRRSPTRQWPVVLVDPADNVGGGSAGDGTVILEALVRHRAKDAVVRHRGP